MKKISIKESDLREVIHQSISKLMEQPAFSVEPNVGETPTETKLRGVFGRYEPEVSDDVIRYMRKNPRLIIQRLIDIYGEKFFTMVDREKDNWADIQGPLDEQVQNDEDDEFYYDRETEKRQEINDYIKYMIPVIKGEEEFDNMHMIEMDFFHYEKSKFDIDVDLTVEVPNTGNPKFDAFLAKELVKHLLRQANEGMDRNEIKVNSVRLK
jgi:hypothetical protein